MNSSSSEAMQRAASRGDLNAVLWMARRMQRDVTAQIGRTIVRTVADAFGRLTRPSKDVPVEMLSRRQLADIGLIGQVRPTSPANDVERGFDRVA